MISVYDSFFRNYISVVLFSFIINYCLEQLITAPVHIKYVPTRAKAVNRDFKILTTDYEYVLNIKFHI